VPDPIDPVLIRRLTLRNFLSFGAESSGIELEALNVFIGPHGSGKSNLIEAISLMRAAPKELSEVTRKGGGAAEWIWKGARRGEAMVESVFGKSGDPFHLRHLIAFDADAGKFTIQDERVENNEHFDPAQTPPPDYFYRRNGGRPLVMSPIGVWGWLANEVETDRSILVLLRDPKNYPALSWLASNYEKIRIYREWTFGRSAVFRVPQRTDLRTDLLEEDFSNLGLYLSRWKTRFPAAKRELLSRLKDLYEGIDDFDVSIEGGAVQVYFMERDFVIPATRLSDGTLRYLCLLAILCDPEPPPLICIEEPELGLHPDILPKLADLLRAASGRTQIIVTTHSDILVDAMTETPEAVVVCEKVDGQTRMERLKREDLAAWLEKYRLGQLWIQGQIGGTRW
jgi:predicted ATPase